MMKHLLRSEQLVQLLFCIALLAFNEVPWWAYLLLALGPDVGMLGYLVGPRTGAITYNLLHHKGLALLMVTIGLAGGLEWLHDQMAPGQILVLAGIILYGHSCMDRIFGFGLKFGDSFQHTHLGWIGKAVPDQAKA